MEKKERAPVYYSEYLQLDKILNAQLPESSKEGIKADDEMLFIIIHQTYEMWFKQILFELNVIRDTFRKENIPNSSPDIYNCVHRIKRICKILEVAVMQMSIMETMTPLDFLDFRDLLRPASGFQSIQFKMIEATLGLGYQQRHGQNYYLSQLNQKDIDRVKEAEEQESLLVLLNKWLERMPYAKAPHVPADYWQQYRNAYESTLQDAEKTNLVTFDKLFINEAEYPAERRFSITANRSALFIMLYRDFPLLHLPFELVSSLLEIDEGLSMWRHRHIHMVQRTIGKRVGTGGSTGAEYLRAAADSHIIFKEIAELTSFLLPRHALPKLSDELVKELGYN
ncbi:MAG: tryptophan 2,3-dioxygenase [Chitinophagales bacterium]|nr:tryptophan 2,3-dioxygenase [Chitinophagales bacterium]